MLFKRNRLDTVHAPKNKSEYLVEELREMKNTTCEVDIYSYCGR